MNQPVNLAGEAANSQEILELNQEYIEQVWARRAALMAQEEAEGDLAERMVVVLLRLGRELLGIEVGYVQAIRPKEILTRVPRVPEWVAGVTNLRGRILSVIDLRRYLGLPPAAQQAPSQRTEESILVLVQSLTMELIFLVDDIPGVEILPVRQDLAGDTLIHYLRPEYVRAVVECADSPSEQRHITVLNMETLLSDPRLVIYEELD